MIEQDFKEFLEGVIKLHYDLIYKANHKTITNQEHFEEWAKNMAAEHAKLTVSLILDINQENE